MVKLQLCTDDDCAHLSDVTSPTSFHRLKRVLNSAGSPLSITLRIFLYTSAIFYDVDPYLAKSPSTARHFSFKGYNFDETIFAIMVLPGDVGAWF